MIIMKTAESLTVVLTNEFQKIVFFKSVSLFFLFSVLSFFFLFLFFRTWKTHCFIEEEFKPDFQKNS